MSLTGYADYTTAISGYYLTFISSTLSIATPAIPTSPLTRGLSESYLKWTTQTLKTLCQIEYIKI